MAVKAPVESLGGSITMETAFKHQLQLIWAYKKTEQNPTYSSSYFRMALGGVIKLLSLLLHTKLASVYACLDF